ncbi:PAS domain-containing protein [Rhizobium wenxiniae]|uniref:PAS domain-containing protein n=1 Tax=Rhizobium wenxiniae TaxID=1737357 RepID=UPI003C13BCD9
MVDPSKLTERQRALANFGDFVLDHDDLDEILTEGCRLVAKALGADLAKVVEIDRSDNTGLIRAGVGWNPKIIGVERVDLDARSSEAYAVEKSEPVITNDIEQEQRFTFARFLRDHGVIALVNVPIFLPGRKPYGILQVDARQPREFDTEDIEFLKTYAMVLGPVIDRLKTVEELKTTDERLRLVVDNAKAYVLIISDADDKITDWLGGAEDILGWSAAEAVGLPADIIFTDKDKLAGQPQHELAVANAQGSATNSRWHRRKDGTLVYLDGQTISLRGRKGNLRGYYKIAQDKTDRKLAEDRLAFLRELSDELRALSSIDDIAAFVSQRVADEIGADRVIIGEIVGDSLNVRYEHGESAPSILGIHSLETLGRSFLDAYQPGALIKSDDVAADPALPEAGRASLMDRGIGSFADLMLAHRERGANVLGIQRSSAHRWTVAEEALVRETGDRLRSAMERARAEEALRESEWRLRQFGEASSDVIWTRDAVSLEWDYLSPAFEAIYGRKVDSALAGDSLANWLDLIVEEDRAQAMTGIELVREGKQAVIEYRIKRPDGTLRWLRDTDFPIYGADGKVVRIGGIGQDVTEIRLAQARLEQSEERLRSAIEVGRLGLWDWNVTTGDVHWSDEHFKMEGYEVGEIKPSYEAWIARIHPEDRKEAETALRFSMEKETEFVHEFRTLHPDGSVHWLLGRGRFFYNKSGNPLRMVGSMIETTDRREWEDRQKVLVAELQHRTRNLIGVVRSTADKTARSSVDLDDFRARFRDRLDALARVQGLLSRLKDGVDRVTFDELLRTELSAMGDGSDRVTFDGPLGIRLRSSTVQTLAMALHELATNAVKYGALGQPSARLTISWTFEPEGKNGKPWLHINWLETGVMMPKQGSQPQGTGQGRELIEKALPYQLGATTSYQHVHDGIRCKISIPVSNTVPGKDPDEQETR